MKFLLSPWLQAVKKAKQLIFFRHVLNVQHQCRKLLDIVPNGSCLVELSQLPPCDELSVLRQELSS
ncbi:unnamed protein product [Musa textilis]